MLRLFNHHNATWVDITDVRQISQYCTPATDMTILTLELIKYDNGAAISLREYFSALPSSVEMLDLVNFGIMPSHNFIVLLDYLPTSLSNLRLSESNFGHKPADEISQIMGKALLITQTVDFGPDFFRGRSSADLRQIFAEITASENLDSLDLSQEHWLFEATNGLYLADVFATISPFVKEINLYDVLSRKTVAEKLQIMQSFPDEIQRVVIGSTTLPLEEVKRRYSAALDEDKRSVLPSSSGDFLEIIEPEDVSDSSDYSFYLNCLASVAVVAGTGLIAAAVLFALRPAVMVAGAALITTGVVRAGIALYGMFSNKNQPDSGAFDLGNDEFGAAPSGLL